MIGSHAIELLGATVIASALGSLHCVGMCGPFALIAAQTNPTGTSARKGIFPRMAAYHIGRLVTYLILGSIVGGFVRLMQWDQGGPIQLVSWVGVFIGTLLIAIAIAQLGITLFPKQNAIAWAARASEPEKPDQPTAALPNQNFHSRLMVSWGAALARLRRILPLRGGWQGAFGWGLTTTLLPCGWLYVFVLAASASTSFLMAIATMFAFWIGTLPLLSVSVWGLRWVGERWKPASGVVSSLCILVMGVYLLVSRMGIDTRMMAAELHERGQNEPTSGNVELSRVAEMETGLERLNRIRITLNQGLPCCHQASDIADAGSSEPKGNRSREVGGSSGD